LGLSISIWEVDRSARWIPSQVSGLVAIVLALAEVVSVRVSFVDPGPSFPLVQPEAVPVVESLLTPPTRIDSVPGFGLLYQGLGLTAIHPFGQEFFAKRADLELRGSNPGSGRRSESRGRARFLKSGQPVRQLTRAGARANQYPAPPILTHRRLHGIFQPPQLTGCGFERQPALFFLKIADVKQVAHCA
jgi:hypothetical protein